MSQPGRGPATSLPSLRLLRMTAFGTSRCRPPRCHVAAVSSDRGKNHDPAGTEAASHWSVTPCSPPSRPGRCAVGAGAPSLDRRCARCPGDGWPGQENGASTEQKNRGQAKKSLQSGRRLKNEGRDKQAEQAAGKPTGGPFVAVQHAVVVGEVRDLVQPHHPQCGCDGAPTGHEDRTHHQHHHMVPGRRGERVPEWLHPFSQPAWYIASRCVPHSFIPESIFRGDSPISRLLRIAHVITLDSITQDSTRFSSRHYQRHSWLISLDGILCGSENGQTQAQKGRGNNQMQRDIPSIHEPDYDDPKESYAVFGLAGAEKAWPMLRDVSAAARAFPDVLVASRLEDDARTV